MACACFVWLLPYKEGRGIIVRRSFQREEADGDYAVRIYLRVGDESIVHGGGHRAVRSFKEYSHGLSSFSAIKNRLAFAWRLSGRNDYNYLLGQ
jgi:hypothetical protein